MHTLLVSLDLKDQVNWDYFILLVAKTGMRFSEVLALTPKDFDFPIRHCRSAKHGIIRVTADSSRQRTIICPEDPDRLADGDPVLRAGKKFTGGSADLRKNKGVQFNGK